MRFFLQFINFLKGIYFMVKEKFINAIKRFWWQILIIILILATILITSVGDKCLNSTIKAILENLNLLTAPIIGVLGLILAYPLLQRKLLDGYITKQFEDIHNRNKSIKKMCLQLSEKYPVKAISTHLTKEYLDGVVADLKVLNDLAIDSNVDTYKYSNLVYRALTLFNGRVGDKISDYYRETISSLVHMHLDEIYKFSQSLGSIPKNNATCKPILTNRLKSYVTDNKLYEVESLSGDISYNHTSAPLVLYTANNLFQIKKSDNLLFSCCYEVAPSPSPMVRLMYNNNIYIPPIIEGNTLVMDNTERLHLVGYKRSKSQKMGSADITRYYTFYYSNLTHMGFLSLMATKESIDRFNDIYIRAKILTSDVIDKYTIDGNMVIIQVKDEIVKSYFNANKKLIRDKMKQEMKA